MANSLIEAAENDLRLVRLILNEAHGVDDTIIDLAGYHLQQCVEKSLKALLESVGFDYRSCKHSVGKYCRSVVNQLSGVLSEASVKFLNRNCNVLTDWEVAGRYPSDFTFELQELYDSLVAVEQLFNECSKYLKTSMVQSGTNESRSTINELHVL